MTGSDNNKPKVNICELSLSFAHKLDTHCLQTIEQLNLKLSSKYHIGSTTPRNNRLALWVGVDVNISKLVNAQTVTINDVINTYFTETKGDRNNHFVFAVEKNVKNDYIIVDSSHQWFNDVQGKGFILVRKDLLKKSGHTSSSDADNNAQAYQEALKIVTSELNLYSAWIKGNVYSITVSNQNGLINPTISNCVDLESEDNSINETVKSLIKMVTQRINSSMNAVKLSYSFNADSIKNNITKGSLSGKIIRDFYAIHGLTLSAGDSYVDFVEEHGHITFLSNDIPRLQDIIDHSGSEIIGDMKEYLLAVGSDALNDSDAWSLVDMFMTPEAFCFWDEHLQTALIASMVKRLDYIKFESINFINVEAAA